VSLLALALDRDTEDRLLADIIESGHVIVARPANVRELLSAIEQYSPDALVVGATTGTLTAELLAACDSSGIRVAALVATDEERRYVAGLGLHEVASADASWAEIEIVLSMGEELPERVEERPSPVAEAAAAPRRPRTRTGRRAGRRNPRRVRGPEELSEGLSDELPEETPGEPFGDALEQPGTVIAVWGPAGAPGRTTLAINIAAEIAAAGHTVVLVDVDTYSGTIAPSLGLLDEAPGFAAACRLSGTEALTPAELDRIAYRYNSPRGAFRVLTGIGRPSRWPELSADRVSRTIESLRLWAEYVVLDTGFSLESDEEISSDLFAPRRNAATLAALGAADRVVACGLADPVGMARFLRVWADLAEVIATHRVHVVMNRVRASAVGLGPAAQVNSALRRFGGIEADVLLPNDQDAVDSAVLSGRTLRDAVPRSPVRLAILGFVRNELLPLPPAPAAGRSWRRALGWRGTAQTT